MPSADAVAREVAWLTAFDPTDGLPGLLDTLGGPFGVVQGYWPRTPATRKNQLYLRRTGFRVERFGFNRLMNHYQFSARIVWPLSSSSGDIESVQQLLDNAVDLVVQRITGPLALPLDKTHGARFLQVAEDPCLIDVQFSDPEHAAASGQIEATIKYPASDKDYLG